MVRGAVHVKVGLLVLLAMIAAFASNARHLVTPSAQVPLSSRGSVATRDHLAEVRSRAVDAPGERSSGTAARGYLHILIAGDICSINIDNHHLTRKTSIARAARRETRVSQNIWDRYTACHW